MLRRYAVAAALFAAVIVIPQTAAQADSGLTPSAASVDYGAMPVGFAYANWADQITLTNNGGSDVTLDAGAGAITSSNSDWTWTAAGGGGCFSLVPLVLHPGDSCAFVPLAGWHSAIGFTSTTLTVHTDQGTTDITASGTFTAAVAQYLPHNDSWFATVIGSAVKTHIFYVQNQGNADMHTTSVTLYDGRPLSPSFHIVSDGCTGEPIAAGQTCPITVSFDGPSDWKANTDLVVTTDATHLLGAGPTLDYSISGVRARLAVLSSRLSRRSFTPVDALGSPHGVRYTFRTTNPAHVTLQVVNARGRVVRSWAYKSAHARYRSVSWLGHTDSGSIARPGTYHFRVRLSLFGTTRYGGARRVNVRAA